MSLEAPNADDEFGDEEYIYDMMANHVRIVAEELIIKFWGERCEDFNQDCLLCNKWKQLDDLLENPFSETSQ